MAETHPRPDQTIEELRGAIDRLDDSLVVYIGAIAALSPFVYGDKMDVRYVPVYAGLLQGIRPVESVTELVNKRYLNTNLVGRIKYEREKERALSNRLTIDGFNPYSLEIDVKHPAREAEIIERMTALSQESGLDVEPDFIQSFWSDLMNQSCTRQRMVIGHAKHRDSRLFGQSSAA